MLCNEFDVLEMVSMQSNVISGLMVLIGNVIASQKFVVAFKPILQSASYRINLGRIRIQ